MHPERSPSPTPGPPTDARLLALERLAESALPGTTCRILTGPGGDGSGGWSRSVTAPDGKAMGIVRILSRDSRPPSDAEQRILEDVAALARLVLPLVSTEMEGGRRVLHSIATGEDNHPAQDFDPRRMLARVQKMLGPRAARKGLLLETEMSEEVPTRLHGRSGMMGQLLVALGGHAIAREGRGPVAIRVCLAGDASGKNVRLHAEVESSGPASVPEDWDSLLPGGTLTLETQPGGRARIHVDVSFEKVDSRAGGAAPARPRILLVDDSAVNLKIARSLLLKLGCEVTVAGNGKEAVSSFGEEAFDLVLMDCQMPVMDGFAATREIRKREAPGTRVPIVALTGSTLEAEQRACLEAGMDEVLEKPFRGGDLRALLDRHCRRQAA